MIVKWIFSWISKQLKIYYCYSPSLFLKGLWSKYFKISSTTSERILVFTYLIQLTIPIFAVQFAGQASG
jgi:hypothetical protein